MSYIAGGEVFVAEGLKYRENPRQAVGGGWFLELLELLADIKWTVFGGDGRLRRPRYRVAHDDIGAATLW